MRRRKSIARKRWKKHGHRWKRSASDYAVLNCKFYVVSQVTLTSSLISAEARCVDLTLRSLVANSTPQDDNSLHFSFNLRIAASRSLRAGERGGTRLEVGDSEEAEDDRDPRWQNRPRKDVVFVNGPAF